MRVARRALGRLATLPAMDRRSRTRAIPDSFVLIPIRGDDFTPSLDARIRGPYGGGVG
jgi:hypothetical protein